MIAAVQVKTELSSFQIWLDTQSCKQSQSSISSSTITITIIILMQTITIIIIILKKYLKILILLMMKTIPFPLNICGEVFLSLCFVSFNPSHCQLEHWLVSHFLSTAKPSTNSFTPKHVFGLCCKQGGKAMCIYATSSIVTPFLSASYPGNKNSRFWKFSIQETDNSLHIFCSVHATSLVTLARPFHFIFLWEYI